MARVFYTERDIVDLVNQGVQSLEVTDSMVLTGLAYEKAQALGLRLVREKPDEPPTIPVRPYLNLPTAAHPAAAPAVPASAQTIPDPAPAPVSQPAALQQRITQAVIAKMGSEVDSALLETIVRRVLATTGLK